MKKLITAALAVLMVAALVPQAIAGKKPKQTVEGQIALPAPYTDDSGCYAGLHRRMAILTQEQVNGVIGYHFDIDKKTWNKPFKLVAEGGQGHIDLDIYFYSQFGTPEDVAGDPLNTGSPATIQYNTREAGGEKGKVPATFTKAIVCLYSGGAGQGGGASFTYTAG
jgi:hypothetical protein